MTTKKIIELGTTMGLNFNSSDNFEFALKKGRVVFNGCNGQRFLFESKWSDDKICKNMGEALIMFGKRLKTMEICNALSITQD